MSDTQYVGDYFYVSQEMLESTRKLEAMTNPLYTPGAMAGAAWLRGGNFGYGTRIDPRTDV